MCNANPQQMVMMEKTVRGFLDEGRAFSAFEVTIETRTREGIRLRHKDVQGDCHEISCLRDAVEFGWDDSSGGSVTWCKSQYMKSPGTGWYFVYHPNTFDMSNYKPLQTTQAAGASLPPSPPVVAPDPSVPASIFISPQPTDSGGKNDDGSFSTDYRQRLLVPTSFLREAGLKPGDECHVVCDKTNNIVMLVADGTSFSGQDVRITTQRVERHGDIRLSSTTIKAADLDADKFVIENAQESQTAVVKIAKKD